MDGFIVDLFVDLRRRNDFPPCSQGGAWTRLGALVSEAQPVVAAEQVEHPGLRQLLEVHRRERRNKDVLLQVAELRKREEYTQALELLERR